ncbi:MAG TPA: squalene/phytoene synthase family protein [Spirochaetota bacterium]|nr:squalene/phytoene synthase family protein [Spirochaetota bacterium]
MPIKLAHTSRLQELPILEIGASLWDEERYAAFKACYGVMRAIDDIADQHKKNCEHLTAIERQKIIITMQNVFTNARQKNPVYGRALADYNIPGWIWTEWMQAMIYDLYHNKFATWEDFLAYSEGAAVIPGALFILLAVNGTECRLQLSSRKILALSRPLALFSYIVHILRDFRADVKNGFNYFVDDILQKYEIAPDCLSKAAGQPFLPVNLVACIDEYLRRADAYRRQAKQKLYLLPEGSVLFKSMTIVFILYEQLFFNINTHKNTLSKNKILLPGSYIAQLVRDNI